MSKKRTGPKLNDVNTLVQAGIDPKTGLPYKMVSHDSCNLLNDIRRVLRIIDEQDAVNRFDWLRLPLDISSQELERLIYYKGQLCFFYLKEINKFLCLPYALTSDDDMSIDAYGRFIYVHPIPFASGGKEEKDKSPLATYLANKKLKVLYDVVLPEDLIMNPDFYMNDCCVLIGDYTKQSSETIIPRSQINEPILNVMATCIPYMNTALMNATGITGMRVNSEDEAAQVKLADLGIKQTALEGGRYVPIASNIQFQDLGTSQVAKAEEYLLAMQSLDNFRLSTYGLENGGLFQKKSHMLEAEQKTNSGMNSLVMRDCLYRRQHACNIINSVWGTGTYCVISEEAIGADLDGDGLAIDTDRPEYSNPSSNQEVSNDE